MKNVCFAVVVLLAFACFELGSMHLDLVQWTLVPWVASPLGHYLLAYALVCVPLLLVVWGFHGWRNIARELGLRAHAGIGLGFAIVCTLPMFIGYGWMAGGFAEGVTFTSFVAMSLAAGFFEEITFRGFLFGQLFAHTRMGFVPAIVLCSAVFASGHLYQSSDPWMLAGIFATAFAGSVLFAWLYVEWGWNIWVPVSLHALMDAAWFVFGTGHNAAGGWQANVFRYTTVALAIAITVWHKRRSGRPWIITARTLWHQAPPNGPAADSEPIHSAT